MNWEKKRRIVIERKIGNKYKVENKREEEEYKWMK